MGQACSWTTSLSDLNYNVGITRFCGKCSGEDVGPLQWKGPFRVLVTERVETSSKAGIKKYHPPFFSDSIEDELQNIINPQVNHMATSSNPRSATQDEVHDACRSSWF